MEETSEPLFANGDGQLDEVRERDVPMLSSWLSMVIRFIGACGYSSVIIKADGEPYTRLLLDVIEKA